MWLFCFGNELKSNERKSMCWKSPVHDQMEVVFLHGLASLRWEASMSLQHAFVKQTCDYFASEMILKSNEIRCVCWKSPVHDQMEVAFLHGLTSLRWEASITLQHAFFVLTIMILINISGPLKYLRAMERFLFTSNMTMAHSVFVFQVFGVHLLCIRLAHKEDFV